VSIVFHQAIRVKIFSEKKIKTVIVRADSGQNHHKYWHSTKPTQPEDLFRISTEADQVKIITYIQLSMTLNQSWISGISYLSTK
jgi:hypothetical protein